MKRTDLAAPTVIDPAAFTFVAGVYFGNPGEDMDAMLGEWMAEKVEGSAHGVFLEYVWHNRRTEVRKEYQLAPEGNFMRKGTCDHCGAHFDWGSVYQHTSGQHIVVGNVCADKTMDVPDRATLMANRLKSKIAAAKAAARAAAVARDLAEVEGYSWLYSGPHGNRTLDDIAAKGLKYGGLTFRQIELVKKIHDGTPMEYEVKRDARIAARAAEDAAAQPVPVTTDRVAIEGEVISTKEAEGFRGETIIKMLVKTTQGFKVYGTKPAGLKVSRGTRVAFAARIERSRQDDKFGFFSRPTKARILEGVPL